MLREKIWFAAGLIGLAVSCKTIPLVETCLIGDDGCICYDPRRTPIEREYVLPFDQCRNYIARSPESEEILREWIMRRCK